MKKLKYFLLNNKYNLGLLTVWLIICCFTMTNHEIWRDEAQVWCIVRDMSFIDILKTIRIEGHPPLWYLLLIPFAKSGFSVVSMQIISLLLVMSGVIVLIFTAPFNKFFKTVIVLSSGMLYFLPVVARNYSLIPLFIFLLADLYPKRKEKPYLYIILLILLSNTHFLMFGFCIILSFLFSFEKLEEYFKSNLVPHSAAGSRLKKYKILYPIVILLLNFLILFLLFCNISNDNFVIKEYIEANGKLPIMKIFSQFCDVYFLFLPLFHRCIIFYLSIVLILFSLYKLDKKAFLIFSGSFVYFLWIFAKVWFGGVPYQKAYLLLLILIFCVWIIKYKFITASPNPILPSSSGIPQPSSKCSSLSNNSSLFSNQYINKIFYSYVILLFTLSTIPSFGIVTSDIIYNFSGGKQIAKFIRNNLNEEDTFIVLGYPYTFSPICAYLPDKKFYYYNKNYYITYFDFKDLRNNYNEEFPEKAKYYIVQDNFYLHEDLGFKKIFVSDKENISSKLKKEIFTIYKKE